MAEKGELLTKILTLLMVGALVYVGYAVMNMPAEPEVVTEYKFLKSGPTIEDVTIHGSKGDSDCDANPDPHARRDYDTVRFTNILTEAVKLKFDKDVLWGETTTDTVTVKPLITESVRVPASAGPVPGVEENKYTIFLGEDQCSTEEEDNRPRIIIPPSSGPQ
jgi:hypothetical protein